MNRKIDIDKLPELLDMKLITTNELLEDFFRTLRQEGYLEDKIPADELRKELDNWVKMRRPGFETFFAVLDEKVERDEKDVETTSDKWGHFTLFRVIAMLAGTEEVHVLKKEIRKFSH